MTIRTRLALLWGIVSLMVVLLALAAPNGWSQISTTGTINGTVTDSSGATVPNASVTIVNEQTGAKTVTQSNGDGTFVAPGLQAGLYSLTVAKAGFQTFVESGVEIHPAQVATVNLSMKVGLVTTQVSVTASAAPVETSSGEVSNLVSGQQAATLPLNGRNYQSLSALMPGVVNTAPDTALSQGGRTTRNVMSINGLGTSSTLYVLDGIWNMNTGNMAQTTVTPNPDTIQEVRVLQNNYSVQYSLMGASVVLLQTKSGTKTFHGGAYEYFRNTGLNARNFFSSTVPPLHQNIFGYSLGGPVYVPGRYNTSKNKTFFFWSQQWVVQHQASTLRGPTPTPDMRNGLFNTAIKDPKTGLTFPQISPGHYQIPQSELNKSSLAILSALAPAPNNPAGGFENYLNLEPTINDQRDDEIKVDHNFSGRTRLTGEYLDERQTINNPDLSALGAGNIFPTQREIDVTKNQLAQLQLITTISPLMVNTASVAMNNYVLYLNVAGITERAQVPGFSETLPFSGFGSSHLPLINFTQGGYAPLGVPTSRPLEHASDLEDTVSDDWAWLKGNHYLQAGADVVLGTKRQNAFAGAANGQWTFSGQFTGDAMADFLLGDASAFTQSSTSPRPYIHYKIVSPYVQDRWKATRRWTFTPGLRMEYLPIPQAQPGFESSFNPALYNPAHAPVVNPNATITATSGYNPLNGLVISGRGGTPANFSGAHQYFGAPSLGFAWDVFGDGKTALRGGYGITYTRVPTGDDCSYNCSLNPPLIQSINLSNPAFPNPIGASAKPATVPTLYSQDVSYKPGQIQTYSLSLERQFKGNWLISVGGAGDIGRNIAATWNINQPLPDAPYNFNPLVNTGSYQFTFVPYLGYASITSYSSRENVSWNALEIGVRHSIGSNLFLSTAYTWSHTLTDYNLDVYHPGAYYGNSGFNTPEVVTASWIYSIPWYANAGGWQGVVLGGWKYSGIFTAQSGFSANPGLSTSGRGIAVRPNRVAGSTSGPKTVQQWFNTSAFAAPAAGFFGDAGSGIISGPGVINFDMGFYKDFRIKERHTIEFRGEFFNIFNTANFSGISANLGARNFGQVTSARDPRIAELVLRYDF